MTMSRWLGLSFLVGVVGLVTGCGDGESESSSVDTTPKTLPRTCVPPEGVSGSPTTIDEAITLLNSLPMPVSVPCFVESLDRPLTAYATTSRLSAQPADSPRSPRVFFMRDNLFMSIAIDGQARDLLEFSYLVSDTTSIKGELELPISAPVSPTLLYERIKTGTGTGTKCGACHLPEAPTDLVEGAEAFVSGALQPAPADKIDLPYLLQHCRDCEASSEPARCDMLNAVFGHGVVQQGEFPEDMPFFL